MNDHPPGIRESNSRTYLIVLALVAGALLLYLPVLRFGFVDDDHLQILHNPVLRSIEFFPKYLAEAWSHSTGLPGMPSPAYYRPAFLFWLGTNYQMFGPSTVAYHASAVSLHLVVVALMFMCVLRLTGDLYLSLLATVVFAVHPVHNESVTWVSGAAEPLAAGWLLGSFLCYLQWTRSRSWNYRLASIAMYAMALLSKETGVVFPLIVLAHGWLFVPDQQPRLTARLRRAAVSATPYAIAVAAYLVARQIVGVGNGAVRVEISWLSLFLTLPSVLTFYFEHLLWPFGLSLIYDVDYVRTFSPGAVLLPLAILLACLIPALLSARRRPIAAFALTWTVMFLVPVLALKQLIPNEFVHDRYLYVPSIGFALLLALLLRGLLTHTSTGVRRLGYASTSIVLLAGMGGTIVQNETWKDDLSVFSRAYSIAPGHPRALEGYAVAVANRNCNEAVPLLLKYLERHGPDKNVHYVLGTCYVDLWLHDAADSQLQAAISIAPAFQDAYVQLAMLRLRQNRIAEAEKIITSAGGTRPGEYQAPGLHLVRGEILARQGQWLKAAEEFQQEFEYEPPVYRTRAEMSLREIDQKLRLR